MGPGSFFPIAFYYSVIYNSIIVIILYKSVIIIIIIICFHCPRKPGIATTGVVFQLGEREKPLSF